jgi:thiol-disulfide isomerase/thioredoxin
VNRANYPPIDAGASSARARQPRHLAASLCLAALLLWLLAAACAAGTLQPFESEGGARDFSLADLKGNSHALADYRGKVVVVNFWASWCSPCITEIPSLRDLQEQLAAKPVVILAVNYMEGKFKVHKFTGMVEMPFQVLLDPDGATFKAWGAEVLPTSFLLDAEGRVRHWVQGPIEWTSPEVVDTLEALLREGGAPAPGNAAQRTE